ncbi:hypothetical protein BGZ65_010336, partial [Modicella reniformis]
MLSTGALSQERGELWIQFHAAEVDILTGSGQQETNTEPQVRAQKRMNQVAAR